MLDENKQRCKDIESIIINENLNKMQDLQKKTLQMKMVEVFDL